MVLNTSPELKEYLNHPFQKMPWERGAIRNTRGNILDIIEEWGNSKEGMKEPFSIIRNLENCMCSNMRGGANQNEGVVHQIVNKDTRRYIIKLGVRGRSYCIKISNSEQFIPQYEYEAGIYEIFKQFKQDTWFNYVFFVNNKKKIIEDTVVEYFKKGTGTYAEPNKLLLEGPVSDVKISVDIPGLTKNTHFYLILDWPEGYIPSSTLINNLIAEQPGKASKLIADIFKEVCNSLGILNHTFYFCHCDFKTDNVLISVDDKLNILVKHFDFDLSLFVLKNTGGLTAYFDLRSALDLGAGKSDEKNRTTWWNKHRPTSTLNFLFIFDVYRYWCSIMLTANRDGYFVGINDPFFDTLNLTKVTNKSITFSPNLFVNALKDIVSPAFKKGKMPSMIQIMSQMKPLGNWNKTICSGKTFYKVYTFVREGATTNNIIKY